MIATDVVTCIIAIKSISFIVPTETATCRIGYIIKRVSFIVPTETTTCRIDYIQKLSRSEMVPVRDSFSYNKEIEPVSKYQV